MYDHRGHLNPIARCLRPAPVGSNAVTDCIYHHEDGVSADLYVPQEYQGHPGVAHGGICAMLLDEIMAYAVVVQGATYVVTQRLRITYAAPVLTGEIHLLTARVESFGDQIGVVSGNIFNRTGDILVAATGTFRFKGNIAQPFSRPT